MNKEQRKGGLGGKNSKSFKCNIKKTARMNAKVTEQESRYQQQAENEYFAVMNKKYAPLDKKDATRMQKLAEKEKSDNQKRLDR